MTKLTGIAMSLALMLCMGVQKAQAFHHILFPYIINTANEMTVATLITPATDGTGVSAGVGPWNMHFQYYVKDITSGPAAVCQATSVFIDFTANDMMTWGVGTRWGPAFAQLFNDTNVAPLGTAMSVIGVANHHGYFVSQRPAADSAQVQWGYIYNIDFLNASAWASEALDIPVNDDATATTIAGVGVKDAMFTATFANPGGAAPVELFPAASLPTSFKVTPLGTKMLTDSNNAVDVMLSRTVGGLGPVQGAYDRQENPIDGTVPVTVNCVGDITLTQLAPGILANPLWSANGGWAWMNTLAPATAGTGNAAALRYGAIIHQVTKDAVNGITWDNLIESPSASAMPL